MYSYGEWRLADGAQPDDANSPTMWWSSTCMVHGAAAASSSGVSERRIEVQCVIKETSYSTSRRSAWRSAAERDGGRATLALAQTLSWGGKRACGSLAIVPNQLPA